MSKHYTHWGSQFSGIFVFISPVTRYGKTEAAQTGKQVQESAVLIPRQYTIIFPLLPIIMLQCSRMCSV